MAYQPKSGDIIWVDFDPQSGHEQRGRRPALVVWGDDALSLIPMMSQFAPSVIRTTVFRCIYPCAGPVPIRMDSSCASRTEFLISPPATRNTKIMSPTKFWKRSKTS